MNLEGSPEERRPNPEAVLGEAVRVLVESQPAVREVAARRARERLDGQLYLLFKMGERREGQVVPATATRRLYKLLEGMKLSHEAQAEIYDGLTRGVEATYRRATEEANVSGEVMRIAAEMHIYGTAVFALVDRLRGRIK